MYANLSETQILREKTWLRLIWSQTDPGEVADQSPTDRRLILLESGRGYH